MISKGTSVHIWLHVGGMTYVQREDTWGIVSLRAIPRHKKHWQVKKKRNLGKRLFVLQPLNFVLKRTSDNFTTDCYFNKG